MYADDPDSTTRMKQESFVPGDTATIKSSATLPAKCVPDRSRHDRSAPTNRKKEVVSKVSDWQKRCRERRPDLSGRQWIQMYFRLKGRFRREHVPLKMPGRSFNPGSAEGDKCIIVWIAEGVRSR
jgi:hypothetical protein